MTQDSDLDSKVEAALEAYRCLFPKQYELEKAAFKFDFRPIEIDKFFDDFKEHSSVRSKTRFALLPQSTSAEKEHPRGLALPEIGAPAFPSQAKLSSAKRRVEHQAQGVPQ